jgi:hypothetical protein
MNDDGLTDSVILCRMTSVAAGSRLLLPPRDMYDELFPHLSRNWRYALNLSDWFNLEDLTMQFPNRCFRSSHDFLRRISCIDRKIQTDRFHVSGNVMRQLLVSVGRVPVSLGISHAFEIGDVSILCESAATTTHD